MPRGAKGGDEACHVYLIEGGRSTVKIGLSGNPRRRVAQLQVGSPERARLTHSWEMSRTEAVALEGTLHRAFRWARVSGEWHKIDAEYVQIVGGLFIKGDADGAEKLAHTMMVEEAARVAWKRLAEEAREPRLRFHPEEREEAEEEADIAHDIYMIAVDQRIAAGGETEADRALERARARIPALTEPALAAVEANPNRVWRRPPSGVYGDHRAALARYKEARGIQ